MEKERNRYTNKKETRYSESYLSLTKRSRDAGWEKVKGGYETHFTGEMIATIIFSPILFFTYFIGVIAAVVSCFVPKVHSCIGAVDYDDLPSPFCQRIIHFFFGFVINPKLTKKKKEKKETNKVSPYAKTTQKYSYYKPVKKKKSFKDSISSIGKILAWPFVKIAEGFKALWKKMKDGCGSIGEFLLTVCKVIFFPIILIYKGIKALIMLIADNVDSVGGFFLVLLKIIFFPITLIVKIIQLIRDGDLSDEFKITVLMTFLAAGLAGLYYLAGKTEFIAKLTFEIKVEWFTGLFGKYRITHIIGAKIKESGFILTLILAALIAVVAILETFLVVAAFVLGVILSLLGALLQIVYIMIIPAGLVLFSLIIFFKNFSETEIFGKLLSLIFIVICAIFVYLYSQELIPMLFP